MTQARRFGWISTIAPRKPLPPIGPIQRQRLIREWLAGHKITKCPAIVAPEPHQDLRARKARGAV